MISPKSDTVPCRWCEEPTPYTGTKLCDRCYELSTHIRLDPELAAKMLAAHKEGRL